MIGTAGSVSTGAVDPLLEIARVCKDRGIWFHVDGAYGGVAAAVPEAPDGLRALNLADSVAVDPHKWLYAPLEAGCVLVRDPAALRGAFSYHPVYYHLGEHGTNYVDYGPQNSRGFRALKVWLALKHVGADGYRQMIADDMALSRAMANAVARDPDLQLVTQALSIATFRFVPADLRALIGETRRGVFEQAQRGVARCHSARRRGIRLQCRDWRPLCAARLHRELPHDAAGRRGDSRDRRPSWPGRRRPDAPART